MSVTLDSTETFGGSTDLGKKEPSDSDNIDEVRIDDGTLENDEEVKIE